MKKVIFLLTVILGSMLMQSCFCCDHGFYGPGYGYYDRGPHGGYHGGGHYGHHPRY